MICHRQFEKGTEVIVRTTNGGEIKGRLFCDHYRTYDVVLEGSIVIPSFRIEEVIEAEYDFDPAPKYDGF